MIDLHDFRADDERDYGAPPCDECGAMLGEPCEDWCPSAYGAEGASGCPVCRQVSGCDCDDRADWRADCAGMEAAE